jgi:His-Xaa-Ser system protein HxsD
VTTWDLTKDDRNWIVQFSSEDESIYVEFGRLLNDYSLREQISLKTDKLRERIAISVLTSIENRLKE